eukprot:scaffold151573_cov39-Prasinocladus_malaysianus.AAC.2
MHQTGIYLQRPKIASCLGSVSTQLITKVVVGVRRSLDWVPSDRLKHTLMLMIDSVTSLASDCNSLSLFLDHGVAGLREVHDRGLDLGHQVDAVGDALGADARVLDALEGEVVGPTGGSGVDLDGAALHGVADEHGGVEVFGEHAALQAQPVGVAVLNPFHGRLHPHHWHDGAEGLLPGQAHLRGDVVDEDGVDEVALALPVLAEGGTLVLGVHGQALDEVGRALADDRRDGAVVLRGAH